jgi:hypothetical protein
MFDVDTFLIIPFTNPFSLTSIIFNFFYFSSFGILADTLTGQLVKQTDRLQRSIEVVKPRIQQQPDSGNAEIACQTVITAAQRAEMLEIDWQR